MTVTNLPALVLAGGRSSRMGRDKSLMTVDDKPLAAYIAGRLAEASHRDVFINSSNAELTDCGYPLVQDTLGGFQGPLAGILAGMEKAATTCHDATHMLVVPTDGPFFPSNLGARLQAEANKSETIVMAMWQGRPEPAFALWPLHLVASLKAWLENENSRAIMAFAASHTLKMVEFSPAIGAENPFFNINTPAEFKEAQKRLQSPSRPPVLGIAGWKNSGKTGLTVRLVEELTARGYTVSTIKHAHHDFDIDKVGADSFRHRQAGAHEVTIVSGTRFAIMHELRGEPEPAFEDILARIAPCDIVIIEGYKREPVPKIEARRLEAKNRTPLAPEDPWIKAIAADHAVDGSTLPVFDLDDTQALADFVVHICKLNEK